MNDIEIASNRMAGRRIMVVCMESNKGAEMKHFHSKLILVDGEQTYLLAHWLSDAGVVIEVSKPGALLMHEHDVTELDGSELNLEVP